jgi:hypothetical protein
MMAIDQASMKEHEASIDFVFERMLSGEQVPMGVVQHAIFTAIAIMWMDRQKQRPQILRPN